MLKMQKFFVLVAIARQLQDANTEKTDAKTSEKTGDKKTDGKKTDGKKTDDKKKDEVTEQLVGATLRHYEGEKFCPLSAFVATDQKEHEKTRIGFSLSAACDKKIEGPFSVYATEKDVVEKCPEVEESEKLSDLQFKDKLNSAVISGKYKAKDWQNKNLVFKSKTWTGCGKGADPEIKFNETIGELNHGDFQKGALYIADDQLEYNNTVISLLPPVETDKKGATIGSPGEKFAGMKFSVRLFAKKLDISKNCDALKEGAVLEGWKDVENREFKSGSGYIMFTLDKPEMAAKLVGYTIGVYREGRSKAVGCTTLKSKTRKGFWGGSLFWGRHFGEVGKTEIFDRVCDLF